MKFSKKRGLPAIAPLLAVLIVMVLVVTVGWMLAKHRSESDAPIDESAQVTVPKCDPANKAPDTWQIAYASKQSFSMCVPGGWTMYTGKTSEELYASPPYDIDDSKAPIIKHRDMPGRDGSFDIFWVFSAKQSYLGWAEENNNQESPFTLNDGTTGTRHYTKHGKAEGEGIAPTEGAQDYEYLFEKNGHYYHAIYTVMPGTPNQLTEVESVLKTLKILSVQ
jgi:hypothetical protein